MPIYEQTYREYTGTYRTHFRWAIIIQQELRVLIKSKFFLLMAIASLLHFLLRLMQITIFDVIAQDPNSPFAAVFAGVQDLKVNATMFFDYLRMQSTVVFIVTLFAGSGMIGNDIKNNLMEIYFSKPITWRDYALGKILALALIAAVHSMFPALILVLLHNLMLPSVQTLKESGPWLYAIVGYSLAFIFPCILTILAASAIIKSKNFAAVTIFMLLIANSVMGVTLGETLRSVNYYAISFPLSVNHIGEHLFQNRTIQLQLSPWWCAGYVLAVCTISMLIILRRIKRAEVAQ